MQVCCAAVLLAACTPAAEPFTVVATMPDHGQATEFSMLTTEPYPGFADDLPKGVSAAAARIGNDGCYYYANGNKMVPIYAETGAIICLEV